MKNLGAIGDLLRSERGLLALGGLTICAVLYYLGKIPLDTWKEMSQWIFGVYVGSKTVQGAVTALKAKPASASAAPSPSPEE